MKKNRLLCAAVSLILSCFSVPATALPVFAEGEEEPVLYSYNDLQYRIEEGHIVITSCAVDATKLGIHIQSCRSFQTRQIHEIRHRQQACGEADRDRSHDPLPYDTEFR